MTTITLSDLGEEPIPEKPIVERWPLTERQLYIYQELRTRDQHYLAHACKISWETGRTVEIAEKVKIPKRMRAEIKTCNKEAAIPK